MSEPISIDLKLRSKIPRWLQRRRGNYEAVFGEKATLAGQHVLADLRRFCLPHKSVFDANPFVMARNEGRREVWIHIRSCLEWDDESLARIMEQAERLRREETS